MRSVLFTVVGVSTALGLGGCTVQFATPPVLTIRTVPAPDVDVSAQGPVVDDPSVVAVDVLPPPDARVYLFDDGYPPGTYLYDGFIYYGGYRYPRDLFYHRFVERNIRDGRFRAAENRMHEQEIRNRDRRNFAANHGRMGGGAARPNMARSAPQKKK